MKINAISNETADEVFQLLLNIATTAYILLEHKDDLTHELGKMVALDNDMVIEHLFGDDTARVISKEAAKTVLKLAGRDIPDDNDIPPFSLN